ncbi:sodium:proton antiporter [Methylobacterium planeticum]|uniref:Dehydrogenase n=1 Tax=Methylobacterium planeticum TaxID=2615211 RepID=A0A6N6MR56_9HYPH|nr:sodium:proton antiporter [Methylobacterium planeticum]KAB1072732.1 dehydrogenase [Methylobacterium planeticum]
MSLLPYAVAAWLFGVGLYGIATSRNYIHLIGCLSVCQSATYVLLLGIGYRFDAIAPIFYDHPPGTPAVDPVMQALVLTDIVVGATLTALLLVLALQVYKRTGTLDPERLRPMRGTRAPGPRPRSTDRPPTKRAAPPAARS